MKVQAKPDKASVLILLVDTDPYVRLLQQELLGKQYEVQFASDGDTALESARRLLPRLLITEILVPKVDGLQVCHALKREDATRQIRVLIFSELLARERALQAGADAYLHKPIEERRFLGEVERLLEEAPAAERQG